MTKNIDDTKLHELLGRAVNDLGATMHAALLVIGDRLGLYRGLSEGGPQTSEQLAKRTKTTERYVREWLASQAAGGYVTYDPKTKRFSLTPEQALALANPDSPAFLPGGFQLATALVRDAAKIEEAFRSGKGVGWHEHDPDLFEGTERFFRPGYRANLVSAWIPALEGVEAKLKRGAKVADVGCGHGASTILMAQSFPESAFTGFDYHEPSIRWAAQAAKEAGVDGRVRFEVAKASAFPGKGYEVVTLFDCLHDLGDPVGAARNVRNALAPDGTWLLVEPFANDALEDNLNPIGRTFYSASTLVCTPASLSQEVGLGLGAQAGEQRLREVVQKAGFTRFRRATQTPFNLVLEARP